MGFVIQKAKKEPEEEQTQQSPSQGKFTIKKAPPSSFLRGGIGGGIKEFGAGYLEGAQKSFGGGEDSLMGEEIKRAALMRDIERQMMERQGATPEEIQQKIGPEDERAMNFSEYLDNITGGYFKPTTAIQRIAQESAKEAGEFAAIDMMLPGGAGLKEFYRGAKMGGLFGAGMQIAEEMGGEGGEKLALGITFASLPYLLKKGAAGLKNIYNFGRGLLREPKLAEGVPKFLTESKTPKALADLELSSKDLAGRVSKTSEQMLANLDNSLSKVSKPTFKDTGAFRAAEIEADIISQNQKAILDTISPREEIKESWEGLQKLVEGNFEATQATYRELYDRSEEVASKIKMFPENSYKAAKALEKEMKGGLIDIAEERSISGSASSLRKQVQPSYKPLAETLMDDLKAEGLDVEMEEIIRAMKKLGESPVPPEIAIDRLIKTKRSINRILRKSNITPAPVDLLSPVSRAVKEDILKGLEAAPEARKMYIAAEETYGKAQDIFYNDVILKMRESQTPEDLTSVFIKPSNRERLNKAMGYESKARDLVDRLVVENIAKKPKELAKEIAAENKKYMSSKANRALEELMEYGDSLTSPGQQAIARGNVLQDLQRSFDVGMRPDYTLKLMQNKTGYKLVKDTLNRSPKGKKAWQYLQRQSVSDIINSTLDANKVIDFTKAKDIISDPHVKTMIKDALGADGLQFFEQLQTYGKNMADNIKKFAMRDKPLFERVKEQYLDKGLKYLLYGLTGYTGGTSLIPIMGVELGRMARRRKLFDILAEKTSMKLIEKLGRPNLAPKQTEDLIKKLAMIYGTQKSEESEV